MARRPLVAFTSTSRIGILNVLANTCSVGACVPPSGAAPLPPHAFKAIWDTGATNCAIAQSVVDTCGLVATGMTQVHGVHGDRIVETFLVNIVLPNRVTFEQVRVTKGELVGGDILIGMDIISQGDFAVSNFGGVTQFTFRYPSQVAADYVQEAETQEAIANRPPSPKVVRRKTPKTYGQHKKK